MSSTDTASLFIVFINLFSESLSIQNGTHEQQFTTKLLLLNKTNQHSPVLKELEHQNGACELGRVRVTKKIITNS